MRLIFYFLFFTLPSLALAEPTVTARVSANQLFLGDSLNLTVEVSGVNNMGGAPDLNIPDFQVQKAGQMQSYQWINGQTSSLISFNYILSPTRAGTLQIPPISLQTDGKTYSSQPIQILVTPEESAGPSAASKGVPSASGDIQVPSEGLKPVFMTANVDTSRAYVGQQILFRVQFIRRPDARLSSQPRYSEPNLTGFLVEPLQQQEYTTTINGVPYEVTELRYALFPTSDGEFAIGSAQIEVAVHGQIEPTNPNNFFQSFFGRSEVLRLNTRPIPVIVRALPKNKPPDFTGAVGRFRINAKMDAKDLEVGKPINLILTVEGIGHIKTIKEPLLPEIPGTRRYETISESRVSKEGKYLSGAKQFKILLIPQASGQLVIPPVSFTFFNPAQNDYTTDRSQEMTFQIKPGTLAQGENEPSEPAVSGGPTEGVRIMERDIRFIKQGGVQPLSPPLYRRGFIFILNALPPLFALVGFLIKRRSDTRHNKADYYRARDARRNALRILKKAQKLLANPDPLPFYGAVNSALTGYLADKFQLSSAGLVWLEVEPLLVEKTVPTETIGAIKNILDEADMARFGASSHTDEARGTTLQRTADLITQLEKFL